MTTDDPDDGLPVCTGNEAVASSSEPPPARGCLVVVTSVNGEVLHETPLDVACTAADLKRELMRITGTPESEQLLSFKGRPLADGEALRDLTSFRADREGESIALSVSEVLALSLRRVSPEWSRLVEEVFTGNTAFEQTRSRVRKEVAASSSVARDLLEQLAQLVDEMKVIFEDGLARVNESGSALLAAAGDLQRNRDTVFEVVPRSSKGCRQAAEELASCRNNVLTEVQTNGEVLLKAQRCLGPASKAAVRSLRSCGAAIAASREAWRREGELLRIAKDRGWLFSSLAEELTRNYVVSLKRVMLETEELQVAAETISACRQAQRRAVIVNRKAIKQAEASLHKDQEVIFNWAVDHVSDHRRRDRDFILTVIEANGEALEQAPEAIRRDREVVMAAVAQSSGWALQFAAEELKRDREVVLAAVRRSGWALEHAAKELQGDREIVLTALQSTGEALAFASDALKRDREVVLAAVRRSGGWALRAADPEMRSDREVATEALKQNGLILELLGEDLRADKQMALEAVKANGLSLQYASASLKQDRDVVLEAIDSNPQALQFASPDLRKNEKVVLHAVGKDGFVLEHADPELRAKRSVVLEAIAEAGIGVLEVASPELQDDSEIIASGAAVLSLGIDLGSGGADLSGLLGLSAACPASPGSPDSPGSLGVGSLLDSAGGGAGSAAASVGNTPVSRGAKVGRRRPTARESSWSLSREGPELVQL